MIIRNATIADIENILSLQEKYLVTNLDETAKQDGFVTTRFTPEQVTKLILEEGAVIAAANNIIIGYAFAGSWSFFSQWPIFPYMISQFPEIDASRSFQYGPICIDQEHRGSGLLQKLFDAIRNTMQNRYTQGITFINKANHRSFAAHTQKLHLSIMGEFSYNQNEYHVLSFNNLCTTERCSPL